MNAVEGIARYGVPAHPYAEGELDPLRRADDGRLIAGVGGFAILDEARDQISEAGQAGAATFIVVVGPSGAGRSSVCNHLLALYRDERGVDKKRFIVPQREFRAAGHAGHEVLGQWLIALAQELDELELPLDAGLLEKLNRPFSWIEREAAPIQVGGVLRKLTRTLGDLDPPAAFAGCFENVPDADFVRAAFEAFEHAGTALFLTATDTTAAEETIASRYRRLARIVELTPLHGHDARELVQCRWRGFSEHDSPFDLDGLEAAFSDKARPAARVVRNMRKILNWRLADVGPGAPWPEAEELRFTPDQLKRLVREAEASSG